MSKTHCTVVYFDEDGDPIEETDTMTEGCIPGVARTLQREGVKSVEVHFTDGTSAEYKFLPEGSRIKTRRISE